MSNEITGSRVDGLEAIRERLLCFASPIGLGHSYSRLR